MSIRYILFDPEAPSLGQCVKVVRAESSDDLRAMIGCELLEYVPARIAGVDCFLICDEEGRLKDPMPAMSAVMRFDEGFCDFTRGRILVTTFPDDEGNDVDVPAEYIDVVWSSVGRTKDGKFVLITEELR